MCPQALDGIRVLDFTRVLAGPLCTMLLADVGAEVIKVENPYRGDDTRQWGPPWVGELSAYYTSVNRNKRSITLNLKSDEGQAIARQLAQDSDIIVENFKVGQMASFGLNYENLRARNPKLVYCSITGFGQTGTLSKYAGYDFAVQAMSGLMSITGEIDGQPHKVGVAISDVIAGLFANSAILSALHHARATGQGQHIDIALLDTQIAALVNVVSNYLVSGDNPPRFGNQHQNIVPYQTFEASDKPFIVAVGNDKQFRLLAYLIQKPKLADDDRFSTNPMRVKNRELLIPTLQDAFNTKTADEWVSLLLDAGIPAGAINTIQESLDSQHVAERNLIDEIQIPTGELLKLVGSPIKFSETPATTRTPPPTLGQHTAQILREHLNLTSEQITALYESNIL